MSKEGASSYLAIWLQEGKETERQCAQFVNRIPGGTVVCSYCTIRKQQRKTWNMVGMKQSLCWSPLGLQVLRHHTGSAQHRMYSSKTVMQVFEQNALLQRDSLCEDVQRVYTSWGLKDGIEIRVKESKPATCYVGKLWNSRA